jgi:hypothetical protein
METRPGSSSPTVPSGLKLKSPQGTQGARVPWATRRCVPATVLCGTGERGSGRESVQDSYDRSRYGLSWKGLDFALTRYGAPRYAYEGSLRPGGTTRIYTIARLNSVLQPPLRCPSPRQCLGPSQPQLSNQLSWQPTELSTAATNSLRGYRGGLPAPL